MRNAQQPANHDAQPTPRRDFLRQATTLAATLTTALPALQASALTLPPSPDAPDHDFDLDTSILSENREPRVHTLVLHYTATPLAQALDILTNPKRGVSAHYVVPDTAQSGGRFTVYQLVPESDLAHHAGVSAWLGERLINGTSIGMEIVNIGFGPEDNRRPLMEKRWYAYPDNQIDVVCQLAATIVQRHGIAPNRVVGHADVAPGRKLDPGPLFPWQTLYERGIGAWPEAATVAFYRDHMPYAGDVAALQAKLRTYGYDTPQTGQLDRATTNVIESFQMHFCASHRYDGVPDAQTVAVLDALLEKYLDVPRPSADVAAKSRSAATGPNAPDDAASAIYLHP
ncbi:N-acetylmuramoyl-L-alanine amidase [Pandoraea sp. ISTKB]|uniref:N-acetylmuramoyl-L-alanine amidase n=1 Tax=Pandoraea sp. ISTKB TaxID=1586708 RepID=UPI0008468642|nr:N-acetylmuramoyl-L-alanine amidase [Pandoraea sp. ISTKB]ODP33040.1 hypothetical protein A9762_20515 [Pandoraea sp. ISTKB]